MKPLAHQEKFAHDYKGKRLLVHEGGTGKTVCACLWLKDKRDDNALVICPKKVVQKWQDTLKLWGTKATVLSMQEFLKRPHEQWSAIVPDEADEFASPLFVAKRRSQRAAHLYELVQEYPTEVLLLTATPIRSNPWNLHTLLCYIGIYKDWKRWRDYFFELQRLPYLPRPAYMPKKNWRMLIRPFLEKYADIVLLKDCVGELPAETHEKITIYNPPFIETPETIPFFDEHRHDQMGKVEAVIEKAKDFRKIIVVAYYTEQIEYLKQELAKDRETFAISGKVPASQQEDIIRQAQDSDECYFIVQASMGAGFDGDKFSAIFFVSMSYAVRDFVQMKFRVRRIHNLHPVYYGYFFGGAADRAVFKNVEAGKDFVPSEYRYEPA